MKRIISFVLMAVLFICTVPVYADTEKEDKGVNYIVPLILEYDWVRPFSEGLAQVEKNNKFGFIDMTGKEVIPLIYDQASFFSEGVAFVLKDGKYGFIDQNGKEVTPFINYNAESVSKGMATNHINKKWSFVTLSNSQSEYSDLAVFSEGLAGVSKSEKWGFINNHGKMIIPYQYDEVSAFSEGVSAVKIDGKCEYINIKGETIISLNDRYKIINPFSEGLAIVSNGKNNLIHGYIDMTGNEVIPQIYTQAGNFSESTAWVEKDNKKGYIDKNGTQIIPFIYIKASDFHENLAAVSKTYTSSGYIDKSGNTIIPFIYSRAMDFSEGVATVQKDNKWGIISNPISSDSFQIEIMQNGEASPLSQKGIVIDGHIFVPILYVFNFFNIPFVLDETKQIITAINGNNTITMQIGSKLIKRNNWEFPLDMPAIQLNDILYAPIYAVTASLGITASWNCTPSRLTLSELKDSTSYYLVPPILDYYTVSAFSDGIAQVSDSGNTGFINRNGDVIIPTKYEKPAYYSNGFVWLKYYKWGCLDKNGTQIIPFIYDAPGRFSEGLAWVKKDGKIGFIDQTGKTVIPFIYESAGDFSEELAWVKFNGKYGYIDKSGNTIIPFDYDSAQEFSAGIAIVGKNGKEGYIDKTNNVVIPLVYDGIGKFSEGYAWVLEKNSKRGNYGFIDRSGNMIVPYKYPFVADFSEGLARVGNQTYFDYGCLAYIDTSGKEVLPMSYYAATSFTDGFAIVEPYNSWTYEMIDHNGNVFASFKNAMIGEFSEGLASIYIGNKYGYIDKSGNIVLPAVYEKVTNFSEGVAAVKIDGKWGIIEHPLAANVDKNITVLLDSKKIPFDQPPVLENYRTLVPLRAIFESLGASVKWDDETKTVTAVKGDTTITLQIGQYGLNKNGQEILLDVPAKIIGGRTMVPVRAISEALGVKVDWDATTSTVLLTTIENEA